MIWSYVALENGTTVTKDAAQSWYSSVLYDDNLPDLLGCKGLSLCRLQDQKLHKKPVALCANLSIAVSLLQAKIFKLVTSKHAYPTITWATIFQQHCTDVFLYDWILKLIHTMIWCYVWPAFLSLVIPSSPRLHHFFQFQFKSNAEMTQNQHKPTKHFSLMFFSNGMCSLLRSRKLFSPRLWQIAIKWRASIFWPSHFISGRRTNPTSGSGSSYIMRSDSAFFSKML